MSDIKFLILVLLSALMLIGCNGKSDISKNGSSTNEIDTQQKVSTEFNMETLKVVGEDRKYSFNELDLYGKVGLDRADYNIDILDAEDNNILFQVDVPRKGNEMGEGILNKTLEVYIYNTKEDKVNKIETFKNYYVLEGFINKDSYLIMGVKLDDKGDRFYSVLSGEKGELKEIHKGEKTFSFSYWPELIKLDSDFILFEPEIEDNHTEKIIGMNFYKLNNNKLEKKNLNISKDFQVLQTEVSSDRDAFVSFWENKKEKQAYFIYMDKNANIKKIAFPKEYRMLSFALLKNNILVSVQLGDDESACKIVLFDIDSNTLNDSNFQYIHRMTSLSKLGRIMALMGDNSVYSIKIENDELKYEKIIAENIEPAKMSEKIIFNEYNNKVIFSFFTTEKFMETDVK